MSDSAVHVVPFSRLTIYGLGDRETCLSRGCQVISRTLQLMEVHKDLHFLLEDVATLHYYLVAHPEATESVRALVAAGRLELGATWTSVCQHLQTGEALVRNLMIGTGFGERLGADGQTVHAGDTPGVTPQFAQVVARAGLRGAVVPVHRPTDCPVFYLCGLDGSRVECLTAGVGSSLLWLATQGPSEKRKVKSSEIVTELGKKSGCVTLHWGGQLTQHSESALENLVDWADNAEFKIRFGTASGALAGFSGTGELEEVTGETPSLTPFLEPVYPELIPPSTKAVNGLLRAEQAVAMASVVCGYAVSDYDIRTAWTRQLEVMDCHYEGSEAVRIIRERMGDQAEVIHCADRIRQEAQSTIAERVSVGNGPPGTLPVVVFNSLGWNRSDVVEIAVSFLGEEEPADFTRYEMYKIVDARGETVPSQEISGRQTTSAQMQLRFAATGVPAHGYDTYYLVPKAPDAGQLMGIQEPGMMAPDFPEPSFVIEDVEDRVSEPYRGIRAARRFRNRFYDLNVDETTGEVGILDRKLGRSIAKGIALVGREEDLEGGINQYRYTGRKYELMVDRVDLEESGEIQATVLVAGRLASSRVEIRYRMYGEIDRIDVDVSLSWTDEKPVRIQVEFPIGEGKVHYGVPFGHNTLDNVIEGSGPFRDGDMDRETWDKQRECQGWISVDGKDGGMVLASDRRAFEFDKGLVRGDVLRSCPDPASYSYHKVWRRYPEKVTCRYSLRGYEGNFAEARAYQDGEALNQPLDTRCVYDADSPKPLPSSMSVVDLQGEGIVTTAFKNVENREGYIMRAYETIGNSSEAKLVTNVGLKHLSEVDLLEKGSVELDPDRILFAPFEIKTMWFDLDSDV